MYGITNHIRELHIYIILWFKRASLRMWFVIR